MRSICWDCSSHRQGRHREAADLIARALDLQPNDVQAFVNLGAVQMALGDKAAGIASFRRATELAPDHPPAWRNLALALLENREPAAAGEIFARISHELIPARPRPGTIWARRAIARAIPLVPPKRCRRRCASLRVLPAPGAIWVPCRSIRGQDDAAIASFSQAIAIEPSHIDAHVFRGACLSSPGAVRRRLARLRLAPETAPWSSRRPGFQSTALAGRGFHRAAPSGPCRAGSGRHDPVHALCAIGESEGRGGDRRGSGTAAPPGIAGSGYAGHRGGGRGRSAAGVRSSLSAALTAADLRH